MTDPCLTEIEVTKKPVKCIQANSTELPPSPAVDLCRLRPPLFLIPPLLSLK